MYVQFVTKAKAWIDENSDTEIRLASIGFSRGAEQATRLARLAHERGTQDPAEMTIKRDAKGLIESVEFTRPPLVEPGRTPQAVGLFDLFQSTRVLDPGMTDRARFDQHHRIRNWSRSSRSSGQGRQAISRNPNTAGTSIRRISIYGL
ncbi:hypothetical protein [Thermomonas sp. LB-4]|uniref:hypothetical protein n=1 Tax=Thermomonas sp. LB-4 TaxID=3102790 RepID=UPI002EDAA035